MLLFLSWACQQESLTEEAKGAFSIALAEDTLALQTKAQQAISDELAAQFQLTVRNAAGYTFYEGGYTANPITVPAGTYTLRATFGKENDLAIDAPYYAGEVSGVAVEATQSKAVTIPCQLANALVSVNWANQAKIDKVFTNYGVKVAVNSYSAILSPENSNRKVYMKAGQPVSFYFVGTLKGTNEEKVAQLVSNQLPTSLQAGDHCRLTLTIDDRLAMQIEKAEIKQESINETIPLVWLPKPKVNGFANQATALTYVETEDALPAAISFTAAHALQDVEFTLNLGDEQLQSLNKTYHLSTLTEEEQTALREAGIVLPTLGQTSGSLDLTAMTAHLLTHNGNPVNNEIKIRVKANDRWSAEENAIPVYTIQTVKPEFSVSIYPKNIWTKEFTVNEMQTADVQTGNADVILSDVTYQYSADGIVWETLPDNLTKSQLQPGSICYVRSLYRNAVPSETYVFNTYQAENLPYGDMEEWTESSRELNVGSVLTNKQIVRAYSPNNSVWACVNQKTFEGDPNVKSTYNLNPSTYRETGVSGYAAALRTVGWDNGAGNTSTIVYHVAAGKLFLGTYSYDHSSNTDNYNYGIETSSRPTKLQFYYKYAPYKDDSFKAWIKLENRSYINDQVTTTVLGSGQIINGEQQDSFSEATIDLDYSDYENTKELPITHIVIVFSSSANCSDNEGQETDNLKNYVVSGYGKAKNGSVLTIDNIQLIYDK